jgi:transposase
VAPPQKRSAATGKPVVLIDESGFMLQPTVRRTWAPEGATPVFRAWDRHDRWSVLSALTVSPARRRVGLLFDVWPWNVDAGAVLTMLRNLRRRHPGGFLLVLDRWSVHRSAVRQFLARGRGRVEVEWLPAYAPELNPVEHVWGRTKYTDLANFVPDQAEHLRREVEASLVKTRGRQATLRSFFAHAKLKL